MRRESRQRRRPPDIFLSLHRTSKLFSSTSLKMPRSFTKRKEMTAWNSAEERQKQERNEVQGERGEKRQGVFGGGRNLSPRIAEMLGL